jgi:anti-anti-sigma factor
LKEALVVMSTDYLKVRLERYGQLCLLAVSGEMDTISSAMFTDFTEGVSAAMGPRPERLVMDLSGLRFIDCRGARALAAAARPAPDGPTVVLRSVRPAVRRVFELMDLEVELLAPNRDVPSLDLGRPGGTAAMADSETGKLVRQLQAARSHAENAIADSRKQARNLAATEDRIAATLIHLAALRPKAADRLTKLSQTAILQADQMRAQAG